MKKPFYFFGVACFLITTYACGQDSTRVQASVSIQQPTFIYPTINLEIYPNPASSQIEIAEEVLRKGKQHYLQITDMSGRVLMSNSWQGEKIDISTLSEGMYLISIKRGLLLFSQKLIVRRK